MGSETWVDENGEASWEKKPHQQPNSILSNPIWEYHWQSLNSRQQEAAVALGWDAKKWDDWEWLLPKDVSWDELGKEMRSHLRILNETPRTWEGLDEEVRKHLSTLNETPESWSLLVEGSE